MLRSALLAAAVAVGLGTMGSAQAALVNSLTVAGDAIDSSGLGDASTPNLNRLSIGSDLYYDRFSNSYYGLADRGPGGGVISYDTRVHNFTLDVDHSTGAISDFKMQSSILFEDQSGAAFNGLNPLLLSGDKSNLGRSFDPEGFAVGPNGTFFVSDEYGPTVNEFDSSGKLLRTFTPPANLVPKQGTVENFVDGRGTITTGRQDNRGYEGLTLSPDGKTLYAVLQDPLVNEGSNNDGRRSPNLRIVRYDVATGESTGQFIYQLEAVADINARIDGTANDFGATAQGRNIGLSSITAINDTEFLVIERDNRGIGVDPASNLPIGSKRVYKIDLTGATDVTGIPLANTNVLPSGVTAVSKTLFLDIQDELAKAGLITPEKFEGLAIGPRLADGSYAIIISTDNDFSVTQDTTSFTQFDVCSGGTQVAFGAGCPAGESLLPSYLYAFSARLDNYEPPSRVPEPGTLGLLAASLAGLGWARRRRRS